MSTPIIEFAPTFILVFIYGALIGGIVLYFVKLYKVHVRIEQKLALLIEKIDQNK